MLVLEGGRGGGQPARIYSSQERSRSEALKLYKLIGKYPLKKKRKGNYRRGENVEQAFKKYLGLQHNSLHPPDQVIYLCFSFSPHQEGEGRGEGSRQWGLRRSDVQVSSLQRCHAVPEQHSASCKGSFSQLVLVPRMRKPPALLAFSLCHKSELLSPVKYNQHRRGEGWNGVGL